MQNEAMVMIRSDTKTNREAVLAALPGTRREIVTKTGFIPSTVDRHLLAMQAEGKVHVRGSKPGRSGPHAALWHLGAGHRTQYNPPVALQDMLRMWR